MQLPLLMDPRLTLRHRSKGRIRLGGTPLVQADRETLEGAVAALPGVESVELNPVTGSLLVCHKGSVTLTGLIRAVGPHLPTQPPKAQRYLRQGVELANRAVYHGSAGWLNLRLLMPSLLVYLALRKLSERSFSGGLTTLWLAYAALWTLTEAGER